MSGMSWRASRATSIALVMSLAAASAEGQGAGLPPAKDLIVRYGKAVGGEALKTYKSVRRKSTMDIPGAGMSATIETMQIFPNQVFAKTVIGGMGEMLAGFDGTIAWQTNPMTGPRLLSGPELEEMKQQSDPTASLRTSENIVSSETVEKTSMNDQECYKVKHTWKSGSVTQDCFSVANGLIVATIAKQASQMGEIEVVQMLSDYKDFGATKQPTTITSQMMGQSVVMKLLSVEWDNVDPKEMELPAEIKALKEKK